MIRTGEAPASRHATAVEQLAGLILDNLAKGDRAVPSEPELCSALGVSRTVVREAVRTLSAKGMLAVRRGNGTAVRPFDEWDLFDPQVLRWRFGVGLTPQLIDHLVDFRLSIEPFAARKAATSDTFAVEDLEVSFIRMTHAAEGRGNFIENDLLFHQTILQGTRNPFINRIVPLVSSALRLSFQHSVVDPDVARSALPLHEAVVAAIKARDPRRAEQAMGEVIESSRKDLVDRISGK